MIPKLLRLLGVEDVRPQAVILRATHTEAESRFDRARRQAENVISLADWETERSRQKMISYEEMFDDLRRNR